MFGVRLAGGAATSMFDVLDTMQLHFKKLGRGRPLVMLHGLFGSLDNWLGVAPKLAETFTLFLVDMRNHGLSPHDPEMYYSLMAADVAEFFDQHALDRASVVGHSMGGKTAMRFALDFPDRVEKLVVVDIAPRASPLDHENIFKALLALDLGQFQSRTQMEEALALDIPDLTVRRFLLKNLRSRAGSASSLSPHFEWRIPLDILFKNYVNICAAIPFPGPTSERGCVEDQPQRAATFGTAVPKAFVDAHSNLSVGQKQFPGPALFLRGGKSHYVPENGLPEIRKLFPQATIETIPGAGHWVHADAREEFLERTLRFLTEE